MYIMFRMAKHFPLNDCTIYTACNRAQHSEYVYILNIGIYCFEIYVIVGFMATFSKIGCFILFLILFISLS